MRKVVLLTACLLLLLSTAARAAEAVKIGIVDMEKIVRTSEPGQAALNKLKDQFKDLKESMDKQKAEIDKMRDDMEKQSLVLSQEAKMDKQTMFQRKVRDFQDNVQNYQRKMKVEEDKLSKPVLELIMQVVQEYGKKNGYGVLMDGRGAGVVFVSEAVNVTDQVLVEVNKAYRAKGNK
ncbi:MAG: OmpH family outer membrane protein [Thermodesulfobacteriota bacterium]